MKVPHTRRALVALVLLALGGFFTLLGLLACVFPIPMRSGEGWMFLPVGIVLLAAGAVLALSARRRSGEEARLLAEGQLVPARLLRVRYHPLVGYGSDGLHKRHPWTAVCSYKWEDRTYTLRSGFLWDRPCEGGQSPVVCLDPAHPRRAFLQPESLRYARRAEA